MMQTVERYICEMCGSMYMTKKEALLCEEVHIKPKEIVSALYQSRYTDKRGYPTSLVIKMRDGKLQTYTIKEDR